VTPTPVFTFIDGRLHLERRFMIRTTSTASIHTQLLPPYYAFHLEQPHPHPLNNYTILPSPNTIQFNLQSLILNHSQLDFHHLTFSLPFLFLLLLLFLPPSPLKTQPFSRPKTTTPHPTHKTTTNTHPHQLEPTKPFHLNLNLSTCSISFLQCSDLSCIFSPKRDGDGDGDLLFIVLRERDL